MMNTRNNHYGIEIEIKIGLLIEIEIEIVNFRNWEPACENSVVVGVAWSQAQCRPV